MPADQVETLLERFAGDIGRALPLVAFWVHGSLALGDYQLGRSDLDLVALADKLHCTYVPQHCLADVGREHVTWAMGELFDRIVSPVSRRELILGNRSLLGPSPVGLLPAVTDQELADYIRADLRDYWHPKTALPRLWLQDIWVDLGLLVLARASVTLAEGQLITKRQALEYLADTGAPADVLGDIYRRRYETAQPISDGWRARRAELARTFVRAGIERVLSAEGADAG